MSRVGNARARKTPIQVQLHTGGYVGLEDRALSFLEFPNLAPAWLVFVLEIVIGNENPVAALR